MFLDSKRFPVDQSAQVCAHCNAPRLGRAPICINCDRPWQSAASQGVVVEAESTGPGLSPPSPSPPSPSSPSVRRSFRISSPSAPVSAMGAAGPQVAAAVRTAADEAAEALPLSPQQAQMPPRTGCAPNANPPQPQPQACLFCEGKCTCLQKVLPPAPAKSPPADEEAEAALEDVPLLVDETGSEFYVRGGRGGVTSHARQEGQVTRAVDSV